MPKSEIVVVSADTIDANPYRNLEKYPYVENKIEKLKHSFEDVGIWEGVVARKKGNRYQLAFGHHRVEAARQLKMDVPLIVRDLDDESMIRFMGRENQEDYNADFLCMLETWEAAYEFQKSLFKKSEKLSPSKRRVQPIAVARLLGWTELRSDPAKGVDDLNNTAMACHLAAKLIRDGYLHRYQLHSISITAAKKIVERAHANMERLEKQGNAKGRSCEEIESAKQLIGRAAEATFDDYREGRLASRELAARVNYHAGIEKSGNEPMFSQFAEKLLDMLNHTLSSDASAERLEEVVKAIPAISFESDHALLGKLDQALSNVIFKAEDWRKRLKPKPKAIIEEAYVPTSMLRITKESVQ